MSIPMPEEHTVTNLFTNPEGERTSGEVVVWENLVTNGGFEDGLNGWSVVRATGTSTTAFMSQMWSEDNNGPGIGPSTHLLQLDATGTGSEFYAITLMNDYMAVTPGEFVGAEALVACRSAVQVRVVAQFYENDKTTQMTSESITGEYATHPFYAGARIGIDGEVPQGAAWMRLVLWCRRGDRGTLQGDETAWFDNVRVVTGSSNGEVAAQLSLPYFDETYSPDPDLTPQPRPGGGSQLVGEGYADLTTATSYSVLAIKSHTSDGIVARLLPNMENLDGSNRVKFDIPAGRVRDKGTWIAKVDSTESVSVSNRSIRAGDPLRRTEPSREVENLVHQWGVEHPNNPALTGTYNAYLYGSTNPDDKVQYSQIGLFEDWYTGPFFSGDTKPFIYMGQMVYPRWDGEPHNSTSSFEYYIDEGLWKPEIKWHEGIQKAYHLGVSKGLVEFEGVVIPWSGLKSVTPLPEKEDMTRRYLDGMVYDVRVPPMDYQGKLSAYTYPLELEEAFGTPFLDDTSMRVHGQRHKPFNLSYRTEVGTSNGVEHYKLHFIYGIYTRETVSTYSTINDRPEGATFDFDLMTVSQPVSGYRPTSYFTVDSREENPVVLANLEKYMYGNEGSTPTFPSIEDLRTYLQR